MLNNKSGISSLLAMAALASSMETGASRAQSFIGHLEKSPKLYRPKNAFDHLGHRKPQSGDKLARKAAKGRIGLAALR